MVKGFDKPKTIKLEWTEEPWEFKHIDVKDIKVTEEPWKKPVLVMVTETDVFKPDDET